VAIGQRVVAREQLATGKPPKQSVFANNIHPAAYGRIDA
jgi:hypothetical protein